MPSSRVIAGVQALLGLSNGASCYECGGNEGFPVTSISFSDEPLRSPDAYNRPRNPEAVHVGEFSQDLDLKTARGTERTRYGNSSLPVKWLLPMMTSLTAAQAVKPFMKRTREANPVSTKREFLLKPPITQNYVDGNGDFS